MSVLVTPSCAPSDAGWLAPPSDAGWSSPDGAGAVVSSAPPSVLSGADSVGSLVTSGSEEPESGVVGPSEPDSDAGAGTSASLGVRGSGSTGCDTDGSSGATTSCDGSVGADAGGGGAAGAVVERAFGSLVGGVRQVRGRAGRRLGQLRGQELLLLEELGLPLLAADRRDLRA